jgi:hypothetical protein
MVENSESGTYSYRIDKNDIIMSVSDNWQSFAIKNLCADTCSPARVVGSSLWIFISDRETRHLYEIILKRVRERRKPARLRFRCDAPNIRRFLELSVLPLKDEAVEFRSQIIRTETREPVSLLKNDIKRTEELICICSMCKKIAISNTAWVEIEDAINTLKLFDQERLPQLTHGLCPPCYNDALAVLKKM